MTKIKQFNLDSDVLGNHSGKISTGVLEGRGGVTYDPPGSSGTETSSNVGLAVHSGKRIVLGENGFIRTIVDATWGSALQFGQSNTGAYAGTEIYGGNAGVDLKYSTGTRFETNNDGTETTGVHTVAHTNNQRNGMYTNSDGQLVFFRNNYANNLTTLVIDDETANITSSGDGTFSNSSGHRSLTVKGNTTTNYEGGSLLLANEGMATNYGGTYLYHHKAGGSGTDDAAFNISQRTAAGGYVSNIWNVDYKASAHSFYIPNGGASGAVAMGISSAGAVTKGLQPHALVEKSTTTSVPSSTAVPIIFNEERVDTGSVYNTSNGRFTAPIAGVYLFTVELQANGQTNQMHVGIYLNGGAVGNIDPWINFGDGQRGGSRAMAINMAANDYVQAIGHFGGNSGTLEANRQKASFYLLG